MFNARYVVFAGPSKVSDLVSSLATGVSTGTFKNDLKEALPQPSDLKPKHFAIFLGFSLGLLAIIFAVTRCCDERRKTRRLPQWNTSPSRRRNRQLSIRERGLGRPAPLPTTDVDAECNDNLCVL